MDVTVGELVREWRQRRHLSQLDLANLAEVSTRHLSYVENGRSRPTSAMILRLCERLDVPLRDQNRMLLAGGHAPVHPEHRLSDPPMAEANAALEAILQAHLPYPALVVDRHWELVTANQAAFSIMDGVDEDLLEPPVNVIRLSVHPRGLAPRIANLPEWRAHLVHRLRREHDATGDPALRALLDEAERGAGEVPGIEGRAERRLVDQVAARRVEEEGAALHAGKGDPVHQVLGFRRCHGEADDEVGRAQQFGQFHLRDARVLGARVRVGHQHAHVERQRHVGEPAADGAVADDPDRRAFELAADPRFGHLAAVVAFGRR